MSHQRQAALPTRCGDWWQHKGRASGQVEIHNSGGQCIHWPHTLLNKRQQPLTSAHLRLKRQQNRAGILHCFVLDCSASMLAGHRLAQAKGILLRLFERAYQQRAEAALVCFSGSRAEVRLAPTRARRWNEDWIAPIGGGGGTPLTIGLNCADDLLRRAARYRLQQQRWLWLITDGRSSESPAAPAAAQQITVVDCEQQRIRLGRCRQLADRWQADYLTIDDLISNDIRNEESYS